MHKHTPGPWAIDHARGRTYILAEHRAQVALVGSENMLADDSSAAANAALIASAPDLLQALHAVSADLLDLLSQRMSPEMAQALPSLDEARAAIAKATGEA